MDDLLPSAREDDAAETLIESAAALLRAARPDIPADFVLRLWESATPEDLAVQPREVLAREAEEVWDFLSVRAPGAPKIRCDPPRRADGVAAGAQSAVTLVNDDMPFLFDSALAELAERGLEVRLAVHPVVAVDRDASGRLLRFGAAARPAQARRESLIHLRVDPIEEEDRRTALVRGLQRTLADVRAAVRDWRAMLARTAAAVAAFKAHASALPPNAAADAIEFLEWLAADNFTFLGMRDYAFGRSRRLASIKESGLGILRGPDMAVSDSRDSVPVAPDIRSILDGPRLLVVTKANVRSRVHRRVDMDYVGIKRLTPDGKPAGELRLLGLFTSSAYTQSIRTIPLLRQKADAVLHRSGFAPGGHSGKALINVLETYPRDELFQADEDTLHRFALAILQLEGRPRVRVLPRHDPFGRFVSVLVYVPRDRYDSRVRAAMGEFLAENFGGKVNSFNPYFPEGPLVRIHFIIGRGQGALREPERRNLEQGVAAIVRTWADAFSDALTQVFDPAQVRTLFARYRGAFTLGYREVYPAATAAEDVRTIERLSAQHPLGVVARRRTDVERGAGLKVWSFGRPIPLSERVPVLENMGFQVVNERTFEIEPVPTGARPVWLHDMLLEIADLDIDIEAARARIESCFLNVMRGHAEDDGYNALVQAAGLMWREVVLVRAISRFLRQLRIPYSPDYMWRAARRHPEIAARIVELFHARFDPHFAGSARMRYERQQSLLAQIEAALQSVVSLDDDRILRRFANAVQAAVRTNFYQLDSSGQAKRTIAIKYASRQLEEAPLPRPLYEIFVYSPQVEGVHLRFGKVARGGIRWSDRPQDFRTEVLALAKVQQVKNAVIVPVGAKGGFVPKRLPGGPRDAVQREGVAAYRAFVAALLDVTDNLDGGNVVAPPQVVRHDDDDPYLVVAADKGTAAFSDIANEISQANGFWLDDAFASGGSAGYDHKRMGITARGAWEAVKRHFRELDIDIKRRPFSVAGIGGMAGDVFGNGMLRERTIRLVAAFDQSHIFIDPDPDSDASFAERLRLFQLRRSSWQDYDKGLISRGGGVFSRETKEIRLSREARSLLGIDAQRMTPAALIRAVLAMPVDLLWFGGIGTFVRASDETDDSVGDRSNDAVRVTAAALRCKVIGEGANLGMTQRARIEAALGGVRLNTDAIDNSAGVNTSDLEVNIKIALSRPQRDGRLSPDERRRLLGSMTDEVAGLALRNNYQQTLALSLAQRRGLEDLGFQQRLMQTLERQGLLDRTVEFLPDEIALAERRKRQQPLTRPELALLLAYAKIALHGELLASSVPDDPYLGRELTRYFPAALVERFPEALEQHWLRREIIATQLSNSIINRGGATVAVRIADQSGASSPQVAAAFAAVRGSYGLIALNSDIDALDGQIAGNLQLALYAAVQDLLLDRIVWFLRNVDLSSGLADVIAHYQNGVAAVAGALESAVPGHVAAAVAARKTELIQAGVPAGLAARIAALPVLTAASDIVAVADRCGCGIPAAAATYFSAAELFGTDRLVEPARRMAVADYFDRRALDCALDTIGDAQRRLTTAMVSTGESGAAAVEAWMRPRISDVRRVRAAIDEIAGTGITVSKLTVAASLLEDVAKR